MQPGIVWKIKTTFYGLGTSPIAWETERNNTLRSLIWTHDKLEFRPLPCTGSPCMRSIVLFRPGDDPQVNCDGPFLWKEVGV